MLTVDRTKMWRFFFSWLLLLLSFAVFEVVIVWEQPQWITMKGAGVILIFTLLAAMLAGSASTMLAKIIIVILWLIDSAELFHYQFFRRLFGGADIALAFVEYEDMATSFVGMWRLFLPSIVIVLISLAILVVFFRVARGATHRPYLAYIVLFILLIDVYKVAGQSIHKSEPEHRYIAIYNGMNAVVNYVSKFMLADFEPSKEFAAYQFQEFEPDIKPNIIFYIGESLNPHHMSNFSYTRETTPNLMALQDRYAGQAKIIYSAGVFTRISTPMLMSVVREPEFIGRYRERAGHLVSAAKDRGYQTLLVSTQTLDFMASTSVIEDYDHFIDWQINRDFTDDNFAEYLKGMQVSDKNAPWFWVLNTRSPHSPYAEHVRADTARYTLVKTDNADDKMTNEYDDAVRAADKVVSDALHNVLEKSTRPTLVILTSDHGELVNDNGEFGHGRVSKEVAEVPLIVMSINWPEKTRVPDIGCVGNHYQLGEYILQLLGFHLVNPNLLASTFYINGTDLYGQGSVVEYELPCTANKTAVVLESNSVDTF